ncbi:hypothetical protein [Nocardia sp. IFM 10818]
MPALAPRIENTVLDDPAGERDARALWAALILHVVSRHWMRLYVPSSVPGKRGKYPDEQRLTWRNLPNRPAAVMIYNGNGRTRTLVFDFDPKPVDASPKPPHTPEPR